MRIAAGRVPELRITRNPPLNMKSVTIGRDIEGKPVWQADYAAFMACVGFKTKLCKPYHPFTKGKVERLVKYVKGEYYAPSISPVSHFAYQ